MEKQKRKLLVKEDIQIKAGKSYGWEKFNLTQQDIQMVDEVINNKHTEYKSFQAYLNSLDAHIQYEVREIRQEPYEFTFTYEVTQYQVEINQIIQINKTAPAEQLSTIDVLEVIRRGVFKPNQTFELSSNNNVLGVVILEENGLFWSTGEAVGLTNEILQAKWKVEPAKKEIGIDQLQNVLIAGKKVCMINEKKQSETMIGQESTLSVEDLTHSKFYVVI